LKDKINFDKKSNENLKDEEIQNASFIDLKVKPKLKL